MTPSLIALLLLVAAAFVGLTLVRVLGARRSVVGLWEMVGGAGLIAAGALLRFWPLGMIGAGLLGWGLWRRRRAQAVAANPPSPERARAAALLGVAPDASTAAVKAAFRQAMASAHPDAGGAPERARDLIAARDFLLHRNKKP